MDLALILEGRRATEVDCGIGRRGFVASIAMPMIDGLMTVGELARRTGMSAKLIRRFTDRGLIYSPGRSDAGYRLYDESALWCVEAICQLRRLGLTLDEITRVGESYLGGSDADVRRLLEDTLRGARHRLESRIDRLETVRERQDEVLSDLSGLRSMVSSDPTRS